MQKISKYTLASILTTLPKWPAAQSTGFCPHCANMEGEGSEKVNNLPQGHHPGGDEVRTWTQDPLAPKPVLFALPIFTRTLSFCCYPAVPWPPSCSSVPQSCHTGSPSRASAPLACEAPKGENWSISPLCVVPGQLPVRATFKGMQPVQSEVPRAWFNLLSPSS